jgi:hypothetical protein
MGLLLWWWFLISPGSKTLSALARFAALDLSNGEGIRLFAQEAL